MRRYGLAAMPLDLKGGSIAHKASGRGKVTIAHFILWEPAYSDFFTTAHNYLSCCFNETSTFLQIMALAGLKFRDRSALLLRYCITIVLVTFYVVCIYLRICTDYCTVMPRVHQSLSLKYFGYRVTGIASASLF